MITDAACAPKAPTATPAHCRRRGLSSQAPAAPLPPRGGVPPADERRDYAAALASRLEHEIEYFQHFEGRELEERRAHAD
ncbi:hypothetical protein, partial [Nocardia wallacei]|uniref:hypothetical protein n=1 Tax=Nocardia wallacei TaxID=480035 RepID=UPI002457D6A1